MILSPLRIALIANLFVHALIGDDCGEVLPIPIVWHSFRPTRALLLPQSGEMVIPILRLYLKVSVYLASDISVHQEFEFLRGGWRRVQGASQKDWKSLRIRRWRG